MLIEEYQIELYTPPWNPGAHRFAARARFAVNISKVLPYLNAVLCGAHYVPSMNTLMLKQGDLLIAFHPHEISITDAANPEDAEQRLKPYIDLVNQTWERRREITPDQRTRLRPTHLAIYRLLPRTNCRECGEATCYLFATKLVLNLRELRDCKPLLEARYRAQLSALEEMLTP
ncbi:MAG: hypothetical protein NZ840_08685 [Anaerolineales bacterium]|nr:hypothetical protein [Anaerolineales bacterium]MDW8162117.1 (Fe-S)-binding protein [Anaerolineales bacterium]